MLTLLLLATLIAIALVGTADLVIRFAFRWLTRP